MGCGNSAPQGPIHAQTVTVQKPASWESISDDCVLDYCLYYMFSQQVQEEACKGSLTAVSTSMAPTFLELQIVPVPGGHILNRKTKSGTGSEMIMNTLNMFKRESRDVLTVTSYVTKDKASNWGGTFMDNPQDVMSAKVSSSVTTYKSDGGLSVSYVCEKPSGYVPGSVLRTYIIPVVVAYATKTFEMLQSQMKNAPAPCTVDGKLLPPIARKEELVARAIAHVPIVDGQLMDN